MTSEDESNELLGDIKFEDTSSITVPENLIDQVIGQDEAVEVIKKAASQRRHVMLIGSPGTGKSMLGKAMSELLPVEDLQDVLVYANPEDNNTPRVRVVPAGRGKQIVDAQKLEARKKVQTRNMFLMIIVMALIVYAYYMGQLLFGIIAAALLFISLRYMLPKEDAMVPKLLVDNNGKKKAPYVDATGAHAGALLGDVRHDPFQSGGLETPSHERVECGSIHKAHKGVLFIDEVNTLRPESQQSLLTALQEGVYQITGQSERSSGALVRTEPVPCSFIMIAAGNLDAVQGMHPALRSRIKGYGYEVYMRDTMEDTLENRNKLIRFVAQEIVRDGKIPHFTQDAVAEIMREAKRRSGRKGHLTLMLRDLGGLIRVSGDVARAESSHLTEVNHVMQAKKMARSVEQQLADRYMERRKDYSMFHSSGDEIGRVNGLAVMGDSGIVLPIMAEITPAQSKEEGKIIATGKLQEIAKEAVTNVSVLIKKFLGEDITKKDVHIQFIGTYEGVEGDSASISIATAVISALEGVPVKQTVAMTGSLSVRGDVMPVGGVTQKIEAAAQAGIKTVLIPKSNMGDVLIDDSMKNSIEIIPVSNISEVFEFAMGSQRTRLIEKLKKFATEKKIGINIPETIPTPIRSI
ncbi:MAG TPA: ATP-dependent protease LonB [Methanothrix soehngenii]|uniref:ATP-dependent protease LonB n=1 Tax=Methanothrix TaxID=2222 RepID=UPI00069190F9|nr:MULTISPECIES: ATP-dependent protease LonB [Methanothrix]MDD3550732.1 ATP-dependent protease LonB [Methanothrix soehngenii]HNT45479.1 ATP-dependent protease LonB [Methanothrix soehngenii]HOI19849.1 ATP-dependent protease LonB [Methanothrix soehngenii]HOS21900.1 ATP-dependent protease LonB [Methanothrix soehngenii]HPE49885.1 ATP-dependent protease LonB [Methanothrix soehngenii]